MNKKIIKMSFLILMSIFIILGVISFNWYRKISQSIDEYDMVVLKRKIDDLLFFSMADSASLEIVLNDSSFSNSFRQRNDLRFFYDSSNDLMTIYSIGFDSRDDKLKSLFSIDKVKFIDCFFQKGDFIIAEFEKPILPVSNIVAKGTFRHDDEISLSVKRLFIDINNKYYKELYGVELGVNAILKPECAKPIGLLIDVKNRIIIPENSETAIDSSLLSLYLQGISSLDLDLIDMVFLNLPIATSKDCFIDL